MQYCGSAKFVWRSFVANFLIPCSGVRRWCKNEKVAGSSWARWVHMDHYIKLEWEGRYVVIAGQAASCSSAVRAVTAATTAINIYSLYAVLLSSAAPRISLWAALGFVHFRIFIKIKCLAPRHEAQQPAARQRCSHPAVLQCCSVSGRTGDA